jgi:predicted transcriptional regulator
MPIEADRFEKLSDNGAVTPGTNEYEVLSFLRENPNKAYTQSEIAKETEIKKGSIGPTLVRLREKGRVEHKGKYWRVSDYDESVGSAVRLSSSVAESYEKEGFDKEEWLKHSVDPREDR